MLVKGARGSEQPNNMKRHGYVVDLMSEPTKAMPWLLYEKKTYLIIHIKVHLIDIQETSNISADMKLLGIPTHRESSLANSKLFTIMGTD